METGDIFAKDNWTKSAFSMIWLMKELMIYNDLEKQFLIKSFVIRHLILPKIQKITDINVDIFNGYLRVYERGYLQWFTIFLKICCHLKRI